MIEILEKTVLEAIEKGIAEVILRKQSVTSPNIEKTIILNDSNYIKINVRQSSNNFLISKLHNKHKNIVIRP